MPGAPYGGPPEQAMGQSPYGAPPGAAPGAPYGQPPGGPSPYGAPPGAQAPVDGAPNFGMAPAMGAAPMVHQPGGMARPGAHGPVGNVRNPIVVLLLGYFCFIYLFFALWSTINELKEFRQKDDLNPILFFIPILGLLEMWKLPEKVLDAKHMAGVPNAQVPHPVLYLFFWPYFLIADLNEVWQAAGGRP